MDKKSSRTSSSTRDKAGRETSTSRKKREESKSSSSSTKKESSRKKESDTKSPGKKEDEKRHRSSKSTKEKEERKSTKERKEKTREEKDDKKSSKSQSKRPDSSSDKKKERDDKDRKDKKDTKEPKDKERKVKEIKRRPTQVILENSDISDDDVHEDKVVTEEPEQEETAAEVDDYNYDDEEVEEEDSSDDESVGEEQVMVETKLDSGNYDLHETEARRRRRENEMREVKAAMERENSGQNKSRLKRTDSGNGSDDYSDQNNKDKHNNRRGSEANREKKKSGFINFSAAKEREKSKQSASMIRSRGDYLLGMINLDVVSYDHLDLPPIRYEAFMRAFGGTNSLQATSQTGEDNIQVEVQTEEVKKESKWCQHPPTLNLQGLQDQDNLDPELVAQQLRGSGGGSQKVAVEKSLEMNSNSVRLVKFISKAGDILNTLLEEDRIRGEGHNYVEEPHRGIEFATSLSVLNLDKVECLENRVVDIVLFSNENPTTLLVTHRINSSLEDDPSESEDTLSRTIITIWNVTQPDRPLYVLTTPELVTTACFQQERSSLVFVGSEWGAINLWDLREPRILHEQLYGENRSEWRGPTFCDNNIHEARVTGIKSLTESVGEDDGLVGGAKDKLSAFRVVSVDYSGKLVIWTVLDFQRDYEKNLGLAHWGQIHAYDVEIDPGDSSHIFVTADNGLVIHASTNPDHRPAPRIFRPELDLSHACARSAAFCPFDEPFLLVGAEDGSIRLHQTNMTDRPLITWAGTVDNQPVKSVVWSPSRPCVFFILDTANRIHLWDLGAGDIYPAHSVQFGDQINSISLSCETGDPRQRQMLAVACKDSRVEIFHLKEEYRAIDDETCDLELDRFLHYVSII